MFEHGAGPDHRRDDERRAPTDAAARCEQRAATTPTSTAGDVDGLSPRCEVERVAQRTWRTTAIATPVCRYTTSPTPRPSRSAAVVRSMRAQPRVQAEQSPAAPQTSTNQSSDAEAWRASSSSGSASPSAGPAGTRTQVEPAAGRERDREQQRDGARLYAATQSSGGGEQRPRGVAAPERPVVAAADEEEAVAEPGLRERGRECRVLRAEPVVGAAVEPEKVCARRSAGAAARSVSSGLLRASSSGRWPKIEPMSSARS